MKISDWGRVFWVKSIEENDPSGDVLPFFQRDSSPHDYGQPEGWFERSRNLLARLDHVPSAIPKSYSPIGVWGLHPYFLLLLTFGIGISLNLLTPQITLEPGQTGNANAHAGFATRVHLVLNPFVALWLWNLLLFLALGIRAFRARWAKISVVHAKSKSWQKQRRAKSAHPFHPEQRLRNWLRFRLNYMKTWHSSLPDSWRFWLERSFHLLALVLIFGAIVGLYARATVIQYTFSWESTFFTEPDHLQGLIDLVFAPAALITGIEIPRLGPQGEPLGGENWIHLFSLTSVFIIGIPRLALIFWAEHRLRKTLKAAHFLKSDPYFLRLQTVSSPLFLLYGLKLDDSKKRDLEEALGFSEPQEWQTLAWGDPVDVDPDHSVFMLFNLAQTPEEEIHGVALDTCFAKSVNGACQIILCVLEPKIRETRLKIWKDLLMARISKGSASKSVNAATVHLAVLQSPGSGSESFFEMEELPW